MLNGKELGEAIRIAVQLKISRGKVKSQADIARHFGIKPPSIHDWFNKGTISKDKLPELFRYFADVVGPEHWGLRSWPSGLDPDRQDELQAATTKDWPFRTIPEDLIRSLTDDQLRRLEDGMRVALAAMGVSAAPKKSAA